jgi:hypothetical protein
MKKIDLIATNVRESGYHVDVPQTPEQRIAAFRGIVARGAFAKIDGTDIDLFSASHVVQIYDALSPENRARFANMRAHQMVSIAYKLAAKVGAKPA